MRCLLIVSYLPVILMATVTTCLAKQVYYVFEIVSDACASQIKSSFTNVGVSNGLYYKVVGENRYYAVVQMEDITAQRNLVLPKDSVVTQYAAEGMENLGKIFNVQGEFTTDTLIPTISDPNSLLTFAEWELHFPKGTTVSDFDNFMNKAVNVFQKMKFFALTLNLVSRYPPKMFSFANLRGHPIDVKDGQKAIGGIGVLAFRVKRIVTV